LNIIHIGIFGKGIAMKIFYGTFVFLMLSSYCIAAPKPSITQGPDGWTVDVGFEHPQQIMLQFAKEDKAKRYWYMIISLTNKTNRDVDFYPKAELMTDTFEIIPAGRSVSKSVFERIRQRHEGKYPFIESFESVSNKILQGSDNTKDIVIIWPDFDAKAKNIKFFISGLSNETAVIEHPIVKDEKGEAKLVFLRKTLELDYALGGDPAYRTEAKLSFEGKRWVMR